MSEDVTSLALKMPGDQSPPAKMQGKAEQLAAARRPIFIIGAPRSGTTWLQLLLSQHPAIATCNETHLFNGYLGGALTTWEGHRAAERSTGLQELVGEEEFYQQIRRLADHVFMRIVSQKPTARFVLEKTPAHVSYWREMRSILPDARFIHLVRDPRSVVASLRNAGRGWGHKWATPGIVANSQRWLRDVTNGLAAEAELGNVCRRITYEELRRDTAAEAAELFAWIGLDVEQDEVQEYVARCDLDALRSGKANPGPWDTRSEPVGFFGTGSRGGAHTDLTRAERGAVEWLVSERMRSFGYAPTGRRPTLPPLRIAIARVVEAIDWRCAKWRSRL